VRGEAVRWHHIESDTGQKHDAAPPRFEAAGANRFEDGDLAREIEIVHAAPQTRLNDRLPGAREGAGGVEDHRYSVEAPVQRLRIGEFDGQVIQAELCAERGKPRRFATGDHRAKPARHCGSDSQFTDIARGSVDEKRARASVPLRQE
jgi:hypothetical protein